MKTLRFAASAAFLLATCACTTARVEPEIKTFAESVAQTRADSAAVIAAALPGEHEAEIAEAANNGDAWYLSDGCTSMSRLTTTEAAGACDIVRDRFDSSPRPVGPATAAGRKLAILDDYVQALNQLANAQSDAAVTTAWAAALGSVSDLAAAAGSNGLGAFAAKLDAARPKTDPAVSFAIRSLRYAKLRSVVTQSDDAVFEVTRAIQLELRDLGADPEFTRLAADMDAANAAALALDSTTPKLQYAAALAELERSHAAFVAYYDKSIYVRVGRIGTAHRALARALRSPGSAENVVTYLEELKALATAIEK